MILDLNIPSDRQKFRTYTDFLLKRQCVVEVKERKRQRSLSQNAYLHVILSYFASEFGYDEEYVKYDIFKKLVNKETFMRERDWKGRRVTYYRSTANLDTGEMSLCIDRFRNWCANEAGLYIPEANEYDALLEAEKQIALYEKYL